MKGAMKMAKRMMGLVMTFFMVVASIMIPTGRVDAAVTDSSLREQIVTTHSMVKMTNGVYANQCSQYVWRELIARGIFTGSNDNENAFTNGNKWCDRFYDGGTTSGGYKISKYTGSNALNNLSSNGTKNIYDIVVSYKNQYNSNGGAGHVVYIHAIYNGKVYLSEHYAYSGIAIGQPLVINYSSFISQWNKMYTCSVAAMVFTKPSNSYADVDISVSDISPISATISCDVNTNKQIKEVKATLWSEDYGYDYYQTINSTTSNGNHYTFKANYAEWKTRGIYRGYIHVYYTDGTHQRSEKRFEYVIPENFLPSGRISSVVSESIGTIKVSGYAFDQDNMNKGVRIDVYIGGSAGTSGAEYHSILAGTSNNMYKYEETIKTNKTGKQQVYIYAIDHNGDCYTCLGSKEVDIKSNKAPTMNVEVVESNKLGMIRVAGWAFDPDVVNAHTEIHIYVGGSGAAAAAGVKCWGTNTTANIDGRPDVNAVFGCGNDHGFDVTFPTSLTGKQPVYVYALDCSDPNKHTLMGPYEVDIHSSHNKKIVERTEPSCEENGKVTYRCSVCNEIVAEDTIPALGHTEVIDAEVAPTYENTGLTKGIHCSVCGKVIVPQQTIDKLIPEKQDEVVVPAETIEQPNQNITPQTTSDVATENVPVSKPTTIAKEIKEATTKNEEIKTVQKKVKKSGKKIGDVITDEDSNARYKIESSKTVIYVKLLDADSTEIVVPDYILVDEKKYSVVGVAKNAFAKNKNIEKLEIGKNVTTIDKNVIPVENILQELYIRTAKLTKKTIAKNAFKGMDKKVSVYVPKKKQKEYIKLLRSKGLSRKVTVYWWK